MKKNISVWELIFILIISAILISGATYAFWTWNSNTNKNVVFTTANLEKYVVYDEGNSSFVGNFLPTNTYCESVNTTLSFYKKDEAINIPLYASIKMDVNEIGTNISNSKDVYWVVTSGDNISCEGLLESDNVVSYGNFNNISANDVIILKDNIEITLEKHIYTIWIWIDNGKEDLSSLSGEVIDVNVWTEITMKELEGNLITVNFDANYGTFETTTYTTSGAYTYTAPYDGEYRLEVWGAQGGTGVVNGKTTYVGGYGGYSAGSVMLTLGTELSVNVGGKGVDATDSEIGGGGGYNGGGTGGMDSNYSSSGGNEPGAGGGGATHIATSNGVLSTFANNKSQLLIVAGGGGGGAYDGQGGSGGGYQGLSGVSSSTVIGTQISGNAFGLGGNGVSETGGSGGGGGGYYGGGGGYGNGDSGGGGSGYIGNSLLIDKYMYCYNCNKFDDVNALTYTTTNVSNDAISDYAKSGDGSAAITLLNVSKNITTGELYGELPKPVRKYGYEFIGWNTESDGSGDTITEDTIVKIGESHTLYAVWNKKSLNTALTDFTNGLSLELWFSEGNSQLYQTSATVEKIDLTNYRTLVGTVAKTGSGAKICVSTDQTVDGCVKEISLNTGSVYVDDNNIFRLNLTEITGSYYIVLYASAMWNSSITLTVEDVYLTTEGDIFGGFTNGLSITAKFAEGVGPDKITSASDNKINLTNYSKVKFNVSCGITSSYGSSKVCVSTDQTANNCVVSASVPETGTYELDVSTLSGSYYIVLYASANWNSSGTLTVSSIELVE